MKKLTWTIILAFGLASLPFGGTALAGQGHHKAAAHAGKHHGKQHHPNHAGRHFKNK